MLVASQTCQLQSRATKSHLKDKNPRSFIYNFNNNHLILKRQIMVFWTHQCYLLRMEKEFFTCLTHKICSPTVLVKENRNAWVNYLYHSIVKVIYANIKSLHFFWRWFTHLYIMIITVHQDWKAAASRALHTHTTRNTWGQTDSGPGNAYTQGKDKDLFLTAVS